jgi:hypothetical protein
MGASSAQAMTKGRLQGLQMEQIEAQFLAAAALLRQVEPSSDRTCDAAAQQLQSQLAASLPPVEAGVVRQLSLVPGSIHLQLTLAGEGGLRRKRLFSPAAAGLCGPVSSWSQEGAHAAL